MVSRFLTELPIKALPQGPDRFLIEDIVDVGTKTTTFSALKEYLGITGPEGLNDVGTESGNVRIGNTLSNVTMSAANVNITTGTAFNLNPINSKTTNLNTGAGASTTTVGYSSNNNFIVLNSKKITAPHIDSDLVVNSSLMTRSLADGRYAQVFSNVLVADSSNIQGSTFQPVLSINGLLPDTLYEIRSLLRVFVQRDDVGSLPTQMKLHYSGTTSLASYSVSTSLGNTLTATDNYTSNAFPSYISQVFTSVDANVYYVINGMIKTGTTGNFSVQINFDAGGTSAEYVEAKAGSYLILSKL